MNQNISEHKYLFHHGANYRSYEFLGAHMTGKSAGKEAAVPAKEAEPAKEQISSKDSAVVKETAPGKQAAPSKEQPAEVTTEGPE